MTPEQLQEIASRYAGLKVAVAGDIALDRYLHIDPSIEEISIETGLPVHNVVAVRPQGGAGGNVLANLAALGPASLVAVGYCGDDGEGYELRRALEAFGTDLSHFITAPERMTFTYTKPLVIRPGEAPEELNRLDIRTRTPIGAELEGQIISHLRAAAASADVVVAMDQTPEPPNGVFTRKVKSALAEIAREFPEKVILADSRTSIGDFTDVRIKVNEPELRAHLGADASANVMDLALRWSGRIGRDVFVTMGRDGILAASGGRLSHAPGVVVEGTVDEVGAGDAAVASLAMALGAGSGAAEAAEIANLAGSIVVRKIGTTGTATIEELSEAAARTH